MKTRKILTCMLAGIMSISALTGCAGGTQTNSTDTTTANAPANTSAAQKNETAADETKTNEEPITLDMYFPV